MVAVSILSGVSGQRRQRSLFAENNETVSGMGLAYLAEKWKYGGKREAPQTGAACERQLGGKLSTACVKFEIMCLLHMQPWL